MIKKLRKGFCLPNSTPRMVTQLISDILQPEALTVPLTMSDNGGEKETLLTLPEPIRSQRVNEILREKTKGEPKSEEFLRGLSEEKKLSLAEGFLQVESKRKRMDDISEIFIENFFLNSKGNETKTPNFLLSRHNIKQIKNIPAVFSPELKVINWKDLFFLFQSKSIKTSVVPVNAKALISQALSDSFDLRNSFFLFTSLEKLIGEDLTDMKSEVLDSLEPLASLEFENQLFKILRHNPERFVGQEKIDFFVVGAIIGWLSLAKMDSHPQAYELMVNHLLTHMMSSPSFEDMTYSEISFIMTKFASGAPKSQVNKDLLQKLVNHKAFYLSFNDESIDIARLFLDADLNIPLMPMQFSNALNKVIPLKNIASNFLILLQGNSNLSRCTSLFTHHMIRPFFSNMRRVPKEKIEDWASTYRFCMLSFLKLMSPISYAVLRNSMTNYRLPAFKPDEKNQISPNALLSELNDFVAICGKFGTNFRFFMDFVSNQQGIDFVDSKKSLGEANGFIEAYFLAFQEQVVGLSSSPEFSEQFSQFVRSKYLSIRSIRSFDKTFQTSLEPLNKLILESFRGAQNDIFKLLHLLDFGWLYSEKEAAEIIDHFISSQDLRNPQKLKIFIEFVFKQETEECLLVLVRNPEFCSLFVPAYTQFLLDVSQSFIDPSNPMIIEYSIFNSNHFRFKITPFLIREIKQSNKSADLSELIQVAYKFNYSKILGTDLLDLVVLMTKEPELVPLFGNVAKNLSSLFRGVLFSGKNKSVQLISLYKLPSLSSLSENSVSAIKKLIIDFCNSGSEELEFSEVYSLLLFSLAFDDQNIDADLLAAILSRVPGGSNSRLDSLYSKIDVLTLKGANLDLFLKIHLRALNNSALTEFNSYLVEFFKKFTPENIPMLYNILVYCVKEKLSLPEFIPLILTHFEALYKHNHAAFDLLMTFEPEENELFSICDFVLHNLEKYTHSKEALINILFNYFFSLANKKRSKPEMETLEKSFEEILERIVLEEDYYKISVVNKVNGVPYFKSFLDLAPIWDIAPTKSSGVLFSELSFETMKCHNNEPFLTFNKNLMNKISHPHHVHIFQKLFFFKKLEKKIKNYFKASADSFVLNDYVFAVEFKRLQTMMNIRLGMHKRFEFTNIIPNENKSLTLYRPFELFAKSISYGEVMLRTSFLMEHEKIQIGFLFPSYNNSICKFTLLEAQTKDFRDAVKNIRIDTKYIIHSMPNEVAASANEDSNC